MKCNVMYGRDRALTPMEPYGVLFPGASVSVRGEAFPHEDPTTLGTKMVPDHSRKIPDFNMERTV